MDFINSTALLTASTEEVNDKIMWFFTQNDLRTMTSSLLSWFGKLAANIIIAIIIWQVGKRFIKLAVKFITRVLKKTDLDAGVVKFILSLAKFTLYIVLIIMVIDRLGVQTSSFIAILGSAGLAFGLALQGSLSNFAGGILILIFRPFKVGDYIVAGTDEGTVVAVDLLYTKLLTLDNKTVMIPNGGLSNSSITSVISQEKRMLSIEISVGYNSNIKLAKSLLENKINDNDKILRDKPIKVFVKNLDESCIVVESRMWVMTDDYWEVKWQLLEEFKEVFDENGIEIPFNQLDVNLKTK